MFLKIKHDFNSVWPCIKDIANSHRHATIALAVYWSRERNTTVLSTLVWLYVPLHPDYKRLIIRSSCFFKKQKRRLIENDTQSPNAGRSVTHTFRVLRIFPHTFFILQSSSSSGQIVATVVARSRRRDNKLYLTRLNAIVFNFVVSRVLLGFHPFSMRFSQSPSRTKTRVVFAYIR